MAVVITYGSQVISSAGTTGSGYSLFLSDVHEFSMSYPVATLEATVVIVGTGSDLQFATALQALRTALRTPNQGLTVEVEGEDQFAGTPGAHTFMNAQPSFTVDPSYSTAKSAALRLQIVGHLPADLAGQGGRLTGSTLITPTSEGRQIVTVKAGYTGLSGTSASGHLSTFESYASGLVGAMAGTYEILAPASLDYDDFDQSCSFETVYIQILTAQSPQGTDDTRLVGTQYRVTITQASQEFAGPQQNPTAKVSLATPGQGAPPSLVRVEFSTGVKVSASETVADMVAIIRPFLKTKASEAGATAGLDVVGEQITVNLDERRAGGYVDYLAYNSNLVASKVDLEETELLGNHVIPVLDGNDPRASDLHVGPQLAARTVRIFTRVVGTVSDEAEKIAKSAIEEAKSANFVHFSSRVAKEHLDLMLSTGARSTRFVETGIVLAFVYHKAKKVRPTTGNSSGSLKASG